MTFHTFPSKCLGPLQLYVTALEFIELQFVLNVGRENAVQCSKMMQVMLECNVFQVLSQKEKYSGAKFLW